MESFLIKDAEYGPAHFVFFSDFLYIFFNPKKNEWEKCFQNQDFWTSLQSLLWSVVIETYVVSVSNAWTIAGVLIPQSRENEDV